MWRQRVYFRFVMSIVPSPFVSLIIISSQFLILVSKHMYTWQKQQGWWSVVWDGKNWWFCHMLIGSFVHFYFYVNIYSLLSSLHWCLKYQKKILPWIHQIVFIPIFFLIAISWCKLMNAPDSVPPYRLLHTPLHRGNKANKKEKTKETGFQGSM